MTVLTDIQIKYWDYVEGKRHNIAYEGETQRHNYATEHQQAQELVETVRHNTVYEGETNRHNVVYENETKRHNVATEGIQRTQASASMMQAQASQRQAGAAERQAQAASDNAVNNAIVGASTAAYNRERTQEQHYQNAVTGARNDMDISLAPASAAADYAGRVTGAGGALLGGIGRVGGKVPAINIY